MLLAFRKYVLALCTALPFTGSRVHGQHKILSRFIASPSDCLQNELDGLLVACQIRGKSALVTYRGKNYPAAYLKIDSRQGSPEFDNMSQIETHFDNA